MNQRNVFFPKNSSQFNTFVLSLNLHSKGRIIIMERQFFYKNILKFFYQMKTDRPLILPESNTFTQTQAQIKLDKADKQSQNNNEKKVPFFHIFRFATTIDLILMILGTFAALAMGVSFPAFAFLWGEITDTFSQNGDQMVEQPKSIMFIFFYVAGSVFVAGWLMFATWMIAGQRQAIACRKAYLKSLLRQEIAWFDMINQSELATKFAADCVSFQSALGQKNASALMTIGMFITGFAISFSIQWLMTLVMFASIPAIVFAGYIFMWSVQQQDQRNQKNYTQAGGFAEQALNAIKTVKMLNGQDFEVQQYKKCLIQVTKKALKYALIAGLGMGLMFGIMIMSYSLGFWYGSHCVQVTDVCSSGQKFTAGDVVAIFFIIQMCGFNFSQLTPALKTIAQGRQAAARIFEIIDRQPKIKNSINPIRPQNLKVIKFQNVTFSYPKDPTKKILDDICLEFNNQSTALVGESGCGKSTIFQLLMRFYDPNQGKITIDGIDLREIDLTWLRQNIGYVGQQPVLFAASIKENLLFGKENASDQEINEALKKAEAYDFVQNLEEKLETYVGTGGSQISGGQKQRIAIARAILRNPKLLLLDEATSALDRKNERLIQATLDNIAQQRTTITIAHRTKTIMGCSMIYVLNKGKVEEKGSFTQLKRFQGVNFEDQNILTQIQPKIYQSKSYSKGNFVQIKIKTKNDSNKDSQKDDYSKIMRKNEFPTKQIQANEQAKTVQPQQQQPQTSKLLQNLQYSTLKRIFSYSKGTRCAFAFAVVMAVINGAIYPTLTIFLSKFLSTLINFDKNREQARNDSNMYALIFLILGIAAFIVNFFQMVLFSHVGQKITQEIRIQTYSKMLRMPIPWFDMPKNKPGSLTARLAADCKTVNAMTTTFVGIMIQNIVTLVSSLIIGLVFQWRTALVTIGLVPLMILSGALEIKQSLGFSNQSDPAYKDSSSLITESMQNIRTVTSFGSENVVLNKYSELMKKPFQVGVKKGNISGILYGITQMIMFFIFGLILFLGTIFIRDNQDVTIEDVFTVIYVIDFGAETVGNNFHFLPDLAAAKKAAASLFQIIDSEDQEQIQARENSKLIKRGIQGNIEFRNVTFKYPTNNSELFKDFNLSLQKGKKIAFVGHSGCGKSTIFQMILRFYYPSEGDIFIDGNNIKDYDIHYLRNSIGVVSQEPVLFNGSFRYNIKYNLQNCTEQQMLAASQQANAYQFIKGEQALSGKSETLIKDVNNEENLQTINENTAQQKDGFDRNVGIKGSHISGGQKQRVAIARTIIRNPVILFLDEATSALDSENQKIVQKSLDNIMKQKTTISIAHRIDTIRNSDEINVFNHGLIVQNGTYQNLVSKKGYFYNLERGTDFL